jgi:CubicO group peptidase (beta-lactamase class C family)
VPDPRPATDQEAASPGDANPADRSPADAQTADTNPTATNPTATNPTATNPTATNPTATNPAATNPAATNPAGGNGLPSGVLAAVDAIADSFQRGGGQPGLAYGVVAAGSLVHARGLGERWLGGPAPDAGTVFRIASMTKSFTAAAVLALRDDGALALDDPAEDYVPELRGLRPATADSPRISIRHLLTMTAGFPTDDPWGDRQQGLPAEKFSEFLSSGVRFAWSPGTRFEYSNLGYAILGRVVAAAAGTGYLEFVRDRLLGPLDLSRTGFDAAQFPAAQLAHGYRRGGTQWAELVPDPNGAFAPMGGIFTCVSDLARWVIGFTAAFPPSEEAVGGPHPVRRATRREMQFPQTGPMVHGPARLMRLIGTSAQANYGFGLFVEEDPAHGRIIQHGGGYPGFGSYMRWHPETGIGVIVLANSTYAAVRPLGERMLDTLIRHRRPVTGDRPQVRGPAPAPGGPWPETLRAQQAVSRLLQSWDDAAARQLFSANVEQDEPFPERRSTVKLIRERIGEFSDDPGRAAEFDSAAHCRWWLRGDRGVAAAEIQLTPERCPRVQSLVLAVPPAPDSPLGQILESLITFLNDSSPHLPDTLPVSASVDASVLLRQLKAAAAWAGPCRPGAFRAGNGETRSTVELDGETARLTLGIVLHPVEHSLQQVDILLGT